MNPVLGRLMGFFLTASGAVLTYVAYLSEPLAILEQGSFGSDVMFTLLCVLAGPWPVAAGVMLIAAPRKPLVEQNGVLAAATAPLLFLVTLSYGLYISGDLADDLGETTRVPHLLAIGVVGLACAAAAHLASVATRRRDLTAALTGLVCWVLAVGLLMLVTAAGMVPFLIADAPAVVSIWWWVVFPAVVIVCAASLALAAPHPVPAARRWLAWGECALVVGFSLALTFSGWVPVLLLLLILGLPLTAATLAAAAAKNLTHRSE